MATKSGVWRVCLSDLLLAAGALMLLGAALMWARSALAAQETANHRYLAAGVPMTLPLPDRASFAPEIAGLPLPTPESPKMQLVAVEPMTTAAVLAETPAGITPTLPTGTTSTPSADKTPTPPADLTPTPQPAEEIRAPSPTALPPSNPVVHLQIPALKVKRAVVPVGLRRDNSGGMSWDTDAIFATNNRPDLVGHLIGSAYPGQGGNVILIGHNYNQVDYGWEGVFVNIKTLQAGDRIVIRGQDGREYAYIVQQVKQVPWRSGNAKELEKHLKFLGPVQSERLTLVTCGGANIWPFPARVYVIAIPEAP